jgi:hypothetical protein
MGIIVGIDSMDIEFIEDSLKVLENLCKMQLAEQIKNKETLGAIYECLKEIIEILKAQ